MNALKTGLALLVSSLLCLAAMVSAFFRKGSGKEAAEKLSRMAEQSLHATELRAKIAEVKAAKALAEAEQEKARDTVDVANDLILGSSVVDDVVGGER